ncbi:MAG: hypothetical protein L0G94_04035 [Brachybacterium sp.]|uniref:hypothetical protein n=1 Tax=Brachybacterium sp. TaxID=1891286 RepID=UPI00264A3452|nr:hypothetical protein [Brachybacterium sp.]MDN5685839.1 hypothetical protein [Brachybacterium sp.]
MKLDSEMRVINGDRPWPDRIDGELREQWDWFRARWNDHDEVVRGPLEVKTTQLEKDPPFAMVGRADQDKSIVVALGYEDTHLRFIRPEGGRQISLPQAARDVGIRPGEMDRAAAAILDGLEQSERIAGRTPADRPSYEWIDVGRLDRYSDALMDGLLEAERTLHDEGLNPDAMWAGSTLDLRDERVERFALKGRSATANVARVLEDGDRTEDLMVAAEVLAANPWEESSLREKVEEDLGERLRNVGLHEVRPQIRREFKSQTVKGIGRMGEQISDRVAEQEKAEEKNTAAPRPAVRERNARRMAQRAPAGIRAEDPVPAPAVRTGVRR